MRSVLSALFASALFVSVASSVAAQQLIYPQSGPITSSFDSPRSYGHHGALDIAGPNASAVVAAHQGRVVFVGWSGGYGRLVRIDHGYGWQTYYAHLSRFAVSVGDRVARGARIGFEGSTGNSTGPHVHFEARRNGVKQRLPGRVGDRVRQGALIPVVSR